MKRFIAVALIFLLVAGFALAEGITAVNDYVAQLGYKAETTKNKSGVFVCDYYEPAKGAHSLVWSDKKNVYTVTASRKKDALQALYIDLVSMYDWDSCTYTAGEDVQFAYNAPDVNAARTYKTLTNYGKAIQRYVTPDAEVTQAPSSGKTQSGTKNYVVNTNSKKFHLPDCADVSKMKEENRQNVRRSREQLIADGYEPCQHCNP